RSTRANVPERTAALSEQRHLQPPLVTATRAPTCAGRERARRVQLEPRYERLETRRVTYCRRDRLSELRKYERAARHHSSPFEQSADHRRCPYTTQARYHSPRAASLQNCASGDHTWAQPSPPPLKMSLPSRGFLWQVDW